MAGVELATAYVSLVVEGSKVAPGVKKAMGSADGEATRAGDRAGKSFTSRFGSALKIGATLAGAFAVTKGVQFLGDAIDEAREASVVTARTANVIKSMGNVAGISAGQVADLSGAISNKVGIDDEAIQSGANLLLTFGNLRDEVGKGNDIFTQTTGLMVDMSKAMDQDMKSSAVMLGKAMNDPIKGLTALSRAGVSFTAQQQEQIKALAESGETMKAQKIILGELKRQFGGAAETMATPAEKAEVAWGNLKEQIGEKLLPTVNRVLGWFSSEGVPAVSKFVDQFDRGKGVGGDVRKVVEDIAGAARTAAGHAADFVGWFRDMPGWAQKAMAGGAAAAFLLPKVPGASALGGGAAKGLGGLISSSKPVPVFVTNPGALGAGGVGGVGGAGGKAGPKGLPKVPAIPLFGGIPLAFPALGSWTKELEAIPPKLEKVNQGLLDIAVAATGGEYKNLQTTFAALDKTFDGLKPPMALNKLDTLAQQSGVSLKDLMSILPGTAARIDKAGLSASDAGRRTKGWKDTIVGLGKETDRVDGKKPTVPWLFPGLEPGRGNTRGLGKDVDDVNRKKPSVGFTFPNLTAGLFNVRDLDREIDGLKSKTITITTIYDSQGNPGGGGGRYKDPLGRASGGTMLAGRAYEVGEAGRELVIPNVNSRVVASNQLSLIRARESAQSGPMVVNVYDVNNKLIGTMHGVIDQREHGKQQRLTAGRATGR